MIVLEKSDVFVSGGCYPHYVQVAFNEDSGEFVVHNVCVHHDGLIDRTSGRYTKSISIASEEFRRRCTDIMRSDAEHVAIKAVIRIKKVETEWRREEGRDVKSHVISVNVEMRLSKKSCFTVEGTIYEKEFFDVEEEKWVFFGYEDNDGWQNLHGELLEKFNAIECASFRWDNALRIITGAYDIFKRGEANGQICYF